MNRKFDGICTKYNVKVKGYVKYLDSSTLEGIEYSKNGMECNYKSIYGCTRNDCPFCIKMPEVVKASY